MIRRVVAFAVLVGLLVGPPLLLGVLGFRDWGSLSLTGVTDVRLLLALLTVVGWVTWLAWVLTVVVELVALLSGRGRPTLRWPALAWPRAVAAGLLAAAFAAQLTPLASGSPGAGLSTSPGEGPAAGPRPVSVPAASGPTVPTGSDGVSSDGASSDRAPLDGEALAATRSGEVLVASRRSVVHPVRIGDDLWSLAQRYYGEGAQWRQIVAANPSLAADPMAELASGTELTIAEPVTLVTVRAGDSLSRLALHHLGDGNRWPEIFQLNRDRIVDPDLIDIGWVLSVPMQIAAASPAESTPAAPGSASAGATADAPSATAPAAAGEQSRMEQPAEVAHVDGPQGDDQRVEIPPRTEAADDQHAAAPSSAEEDPHVRSPRVPVESPDEPTVPSAAQPTASQTAASTSTLAPAAEALAPEVDRTTVVGLVGGMTALTASAVLGGIALRRRWQELARPLGRRVAPPETDRARFEAALGLARLDREPDGDPVGDPDRQDLLERALRHLARHWWETRSGAPSLADVVVGPDAGEFRFLTDPGPPPPGFLRVGDGLGVTWAALRELDHPSHPVAYPGLVTLGEDAEENLVMVDVVGAGTLGVRSEGSPLASEALSAMLVELGCAPWATELHLLVVTEDEGFAHVAGIHRVRTSPDVEAGVLEVERLTRERRGLLGGETWDDVRLDPDRADAWAPHVVLFEREPDAAQIHRLQRAVEGVPTGVAAVLPVGANAGEATWDLTETDGARSVLAGERSLVPQTIPLATREAISSLYAHADTTLTEPAPWWSSDDPEEIVNIIQLHPRPAETHAPRVLLLGPIELVGAAGEQPARAVRSCIEYCAWLIENPGSTPSHMTTDLFVTEGTRRSNLSRLRSWLGTDALGKPYLPEAYSGRMRLHPEVTSDWRDLLTLTEGGVNTMTLERLRAALSLVRGAPLADAAPGQWGWAEHLRTDMAALIRDLGVVAARLAREKGDSDAARWCATRALIAAPDDELLLGERIRTEQAAGRMDEVERLIGRLHRQSRLLGVDLMDETVDLIQQTLEGRLRAREA